MLHQRFPELFTVPFTTLLLQSLKPSTSTATDKDIKEKEDNARIIKQRGLLRILGELEVVGITRKDSGKGATGDLSWAVLKDLVSSCILFSFEKSNLLTLLLRSSLQAKIR